MPGDCIAWPRRLSGMELEKVESPPMYGDDRQITGAPWYQAVGVRILAAGNTIIMGVGNKNG